MSTNAATRVAVVGASGIGKHHAKWWALEGADVCGFVGTCDASVAKTTETLKGLFPFEGRGYTDLAEMLDAEKPDMVDVCSPPALHYDHVRASLAAGCHVLCEKPFVYDREVPHDTLIEQARDLVERAAKAGLRLGVCTQYVAAARIIRGIWKETRSDHMANFYKVHLASPARDRGPDPERIWIDLGPHPLSGLQDLTHGGEICWDTVKTDFDGYGARATFTAKRMSGETIDCEVITGNTTEAPPHIREVTLDDYRFVIGGVNDADGVYCAKIESGDDARVEPDFMRLLIREFLAGTPMADGAVGVTNLEWLLRILAIARKTG